MTKISGYQSLFTQTILDRASRYANDATINIKTMVPGKVRALVYGTYPYDVSIDYSGDEIEQMHCSCPFNGHCKHLAAVLEFLLDSDMDFPDTKADDTGLSLRIQMMEADREDLIDFIEYALNHHPELYETAEVYFQPKEEDRSSDHYSEFVLRKLRTLQSTPEHHWEQEVLDPFGFNDTFDFLFEKEALSDIILLASEIIRKVHSEDWDERYPFADYVDGLLGDVQNYLQQTVAQDAFDEKHRLILWDELTKLLQSIQDGYTARESWKLLASIVKHPSEYRQLAEIVNQAPSSGDDFTSRYNRKKGTIALLQALEKIGSRDEIECFKITNRDVVPIRESLIRDRMQENRYEEAVDLIEEGLVYAEVTDDKGAIRTLESLRLDIALEAGKEQDIRTWARHNIYQHSFSLDRFKSLKQYTPEGDWPEVRDRIIGDMKQNPVQFSRINLLDVYAEEGFYEPLIDALEEQANFRILDRYADHLLPGHKKEFVRLFTDLIYEYIASNTGRKYYRTAAKYLRQLHDWGASKQARKLTQRLREEFSNRPAMLEEFEDL